MKLTVNGIKREVEILPAPKGAFCIFDGCEFPKYPLFVGVCKAVTREEKIRGEFFIYPVFNQGFIISHEVKTLLSKSILMSLLNTYKTWSKKDATLKEAVCDIIHAFRTNGTPIAKNVEDYVAKIMSGAIIEFPKPIK